jgi:hypothetical protein
MIAAIFGWDRVPRKAIASVFIGLALSPLMSVTTSTSAHAAPYKNCTEAKGNGDCDIPSSSDKYQSKLDRDGDGLGCEC